jgi:signal transduction histidine kinase
MASIADFPLRGRSEIKPLRAKVIDKKLARLNRESRNLAGMDGAFPRFGSPGLEPTVRSLAAELGRVREEERKKIADQLHDQIGQNLVLAKMKLHALKSLATDEQTDLMATISDLIDLSINDTRALIHGLHLEWLSEIDLKEALHWLLEQLQAKYRLRCFTDIRSLPKVLKKDIQEVLLQTVRELIVNVAKHAGVNEVKITCESEKGWIRIRVVDGGRGFDLLPVASRNHKGGGFGLMIVQARIGHLGGNLHIDSHAGIGTTATIILPHT